MLRLALALSLSAVGASCGPKPAEPMDAPRPATAAQADVAPAAPPVSNAELPVVAAEAAQAPADTIEAARTETMETFQRIVDEAATQGVAARPYGEIVQWVGEQLIGRPYVAGMLDAPASETLVVDLTAFDCVLYIENVLSLARMIALGETSFQAYADGVRTLRYRDGALDGYCSRLHYFSDWIRDNERRGALTNVTQSIGGEPFEKRLTFMGEHRDAYPKMAVDSTYACIVDMEASLAGAELFYVPQDRIADVYPSLRPGDVIATATSIGGLDVTHTGFVHKTDAHTGFMHASLSSDAVKISDDLAAYVQGIRSQVGVVVVRPTDPRTPVGG
ncbi:N-acetylmuramoyl-L-alanine amidase-like domain-containing protein [Rubrivirga sp.]|uniref:N-acetylmuramoyl-L-alanine amidase-like domain-containing protein n=1 Tax=Rubrivirga sp. TaxID=1885344 RepID=UPI003B51AAAF